MGPEWIDLQLADLVLILALALVIWGNWDIVSRWLPKRWGWKDVTPAAKGVRLWHQDTGKPAMEAALAAFVQSRNVPFADDIIDRGSDLYNLSWCLGELTKASEECALLLREEMLPSSTSQAEELLLEWLEAYRELCRDGRIMWRLRHPEEDDSKYEVSRAAHETMKTALKKMLLGGDFEDVRKKALGILEHTQVYS